MADFVAVLRKTIGALGDNTPAMREKVYNKARSTIDAKLAAISPPPPAALMERQRKALEDAIAVVRADYAEKTGEEDSDLEDVFASLKSMGTVQPRAATPPPLSPSKPVEPVAPAVVDKPLAPAETAKSGATSSELDPAADADGQPPAKQPLGEAAGLAAEQRPYSPGQTRSRTGMVAALVLLLLLAGGGYAVWTNKDDFSRLVGLESGPGGSEEEVVRTAEELVETTPDEEDAQTAEDVAELPPAEASDAAPAMQPEAGDSQKFTQRLLPDGEEVDAGRAGGEPTVGEGTSVSAIAQPENPPAGQESQAETTPGGTPDSPETAQAEEPATETAQTEEPETETAAPETAAVAVGQRAIFYEERTSSAQGSADTGSIVWSIVEESPGGDLPPEPAIRAEASVPGKDVQLRMTIRRNGDDTLPASHIVEMIFLTPDGFEGGNISSVSRISFKETEQAAGNPLIGIPAKIADGFFLIALGEAPAEVEANTTLLRRQSWVDIPIVYQSGRRALLTLEKGIPGDRVFQDALTAWEEASG